MAAPVSTSASTRFYRLFIIAVSVLTLYTVYEGYLYVSKLKRENTYFRSETFYKTVKDSAVATLPPRVREVVVYRPLPAPPYATQQLVQAVAAQVRADVQRQNRLDMARLLAMQRPVSVAKQSKTAALRDTMLIRKSVRTGKPMVTMTKTATFSDPWLQMTSTIIPGEAGRPDSIKAKYVVRNDFNVKAYSKREAKHWWSFGKRRVYVDMTNKNPNATSTKLEAIPVEKK